MMESDFVSVVMPLYNAKPYLAEAIESVLAQTHSKWELIIIDDCSTDGSLAIAEHYSKLDTRIAVYRNESNKGAALTRSAGVPIAKGNYLSFFDADDVWMSNKLADQLAFMRHRRSAMCFTSYETIESDGEVRNIVHVPDHINYDGFLKNTITCSHTIMFNLEKVDRSLLIAPDRDFDFSEDLAVWLQVLKTGIDADGLDSVLAKNRKHAVSRSAKKMRAVRRTWATYRKIEGIGVAYAAYCLVWQLSHAILKRI